MRVHYLCFFIVIFLWVLTSCGYNRKAQIYSAAATTTPHFNSISTNILQPKCLPCHNSKENNFGSYTGVLRRVKAGSPETSSLYTELEKGSMPVDQPMLNDDDLLAVYQWIQNGANND